MPRDVLVGLGLILGFVVSAVGLTIALGAGWAALWAGILLMAASLFLDARGE